METITELIERERCVYVETNSARYGRAECLQRWATYERLIRDKYSPTKDTTVEEAWARRNRHHRYLIHKCDSRKDTPL